jgi:glycosyltransferase involved in cell wall biosynthesis
LNGQAPAPSATKRVVMLLSNPATHDSRPLNEARSLAKAGYQVTILAWDREGETRSDSVLEDGVVVKRMRLRAGHGTPALTVPRLFLFYAWSLVHVLTSRVDVVHCHDVDTLPAGFASKASKLGRTRMVYDMHDLPEAFLRFFPFGQTLQKIFLLTARREADLLVSASEGYVRYLKGAGLRMKRVALVLNAPPLAEGRQPRGPSDRLNVVYYGALEEERGVRLLADAVRDRPGVTLTVAGRGSLGPWVEGVARASSNVKFLGWLNLGELDQVVRDADLIPSLYAPRSTNILLSTPGKLLKSFSISVPAMVSAGTFQAELVARLGCGLAVPWGKPEEVGEAISGLAANRPAYERMTRLAFVAFQKELNWEAMESNLVGAYGEMLSE